MENQQIGLNSSFSTKTEHDKLGGKTSLQKCSSTININANSKKSDQVFNSIGKISSSNKIHLNKENVRVIVRVRPIQDKNESSLNCVSIINEEETQSKQIVLEDPRHRGLPKKYEFDEIYDAESTTKDIYSKEIKDYVDPLLSECSCINVFAFGSSGTGKTFTMHGDLNNEMGIVGLTIKQLIEINNKQIEPGSFSFSFFEIYCEKIQDLLNGVDHLGNINKSTKPARSNVSIRTDICGRVRVVGANSSEFKTWNDFNNIYTSALKKRASGKTAVNSNSSRSHACIQINYIPSISNTTQSEMEVRNEDTIENRRRRGSISFHVKPKIDLNYPRTIVNLIDLSGFENNKITNNTGKRMTESTFINSSLLSLSKVINALKKNAGTHSTQNCIPYRESKLTRLLQEYLGGGADPPYSPYCLRCIMICTISPSITFFQQTYATLNTPSYGNNSIMRKYIGIASSVIGIDSKNNSDSNKNILKSQKNNFNKTLNKTITGGKNSNSNFKNCANIASSEKKSIERIDKKLLCQKNSYKNIESRVAQIIKGKVPLNISKSRRSKEINLTEIHEELVPGINSCKNIVNQSNSVGGVETKHLDVEESKEKLAPVEPKLNRINCNSSRCSNEKETRGGIADKARLSENDSSLSRNWKNYQYCPNNVEDWHFDTSENESTHANIHMLDSKNEKIDVKLNQHNPSLCTKDLKPSEVKTNRPITRSQTKKVLREFPQQ